LILAGIERERRAFQLAETYLSTMPRDCSTPATTPFGQACEVYSIGLASPHKHRKFLSDAPSLQIEKR
jgi:hypothetical protein